MFAELEMMKERFSKLLLGEDMSGGGKGVCTAVTISNSITNLYGNFLDAVTLVSECIKITKTYTNLICSGIIVTTLNAFREENDCILATVFVCLYNIVGLGICSNCVWT